MTHSRISAGLFLAAALLALAVPPSVAGAAARAASIAIVSGSSQTATAFIAQHGPRFETTFETALVVKFAPKGATVRFHCITPNCQFAPSVQPSADRSGPGAYDYKTKSDTASIKLIISTATVEPVTVTATVMTGSHPTVVFHLIER
jgi:hypothetical protein